MHTRTKVLKDDLDKNQDMRKNNNATASGDKQVRKYKKVRNEVAHKGSVECLANPPEVLFNMQRNEEARDLTTMGSNVDDTESPKIVMKETRLNISLEMFFSW